MNRKYDYHFISNASGVCEALSLHPEWHVISITYTGASFVIFYYTDQPDELDLIERL